MKVINWVLFALSAVIVFVGLIMFFVIDSAIIASPVVLGIALFGLLAIAIILFLVGCKVKRVGSKVLLIVSAILVIVNIVLAIILIDRAFISNYFQPLSLSTMLTVTIIAGLAIALASAIMAIIVKNGLQSIAMNGLVLGVMCVFMLWNCFGSMVNMQNTAKEVDLFTSEEGGYTAFRIPALTTLDCSSLNSIYGYKFENDILFAVAEGRVDNMLDRGNIHLVSKLSSDNGATWTDIHVDFATKEVGKYGNPTVVFDKNTGLINMMFMCGLESENYKYTTYNVQGKLNKDLTIQWGEPINLNEQLNQNSGVTVGTNAKALMVGPGKGVQLTSATYMGRLVMPASQGNKSFALYSDDGGLTWNVGASVGDGNENEVLELSNGELMMITRYPIPCASNHMEQYQRFGYSKDGGETWYKQAQESDLKTPICMASIASFGNTVYVSYPNDFLTRGNLAVAVSQDNGSTFDVKPIYNGATGYSCIATNSANKIFILAEVGAVNYCEKLVFLEIK